MACALPTWHTRSLIWHEPSLIWHAHVELLSRVETRRSFWRRPLRRPPPPPPPTWLRRSSHARSSS
eukprot:2337046-Prymnesium_polylepis.2